MIKSMKIRLLPTKEQEEKMFQTIGVCRFAWNWGLDYAIKYYKQNNKSISGRSIRAEFNQYKKQNGFKWINDISSKAYNNEFDLIDIAYKKFYKMMKQPGYVKFSKKTIHKSIRTGKQLTSYDMQGHPKFKKKKDSKQSFYVRNDNMKPNFDNMTVLIEKVGRVKYKSDREIPECKYSNPVCSHNGKYWILSFGIEIESQNFNHTKESICIDLGIKTLATCSNGMAFNNINKSRKMKMLEKKLTRFQRQVSRKYKMNKQGNKFVKTKNIIKLEKKILLLNKKINDIRNNNIHQLTSKITKTLPKRIVVEDLNIQGMMKNKHLAKAIAKSKFYEILRQLEYKSKYYNIDLVKASRWFPSSKLCSCCGQIKVNLKLSDRIYRCNCGNDIDRDMNAAINLSRI